MAASESEASCDEDPNFAVICAFFEKFGELLGVTDVDICELQSMLESTHEVSKYLLDLHVKLLRKIKKSVHIERWEKSLIKFSHTFSSKDAWEVERFGYKNAKLSSKVRILKELLEAQFDFNTKFKSEINKLGSKELRAQPLGRDKFGHAYWFQSDDNYHIRVFKEDLDDEKWTLVARDRTGLVSLITNLSDGDIKISSDSAGNEDSNSLSEKPIIDTGQQDTDSKKTSDDEDSNLERKSQDHDEAKSTPLIKMKNLDDLNPSPKRLREEDEGTIFEKYKIKNLEIRVSKVSKVESEPVVGEAIEEPLMRVEGEGSGEDNDSPIVGETIEEDVMYFFGNGTGRDCQTGNEPEKEEAAGTSNTIEKSKSIEEHIPEKQSDSSLPKANESGKSKDLSCQSPKKFFFGSASSPFKSNSLSSGVAFGAPITDKDRDENHVEEAKKTNVDNKNVYINEPKASEEISMETKSKNNEITDLLEPKEKLQGSKKETDNVDNSLLDRNKEDNIESNVSADDRESEKTVMEPLCVKKFAYICGKDGEGDNDTLVKKSDIVNSSAKEEPESVNTNETTKTPESVVISKDLVNKDNVNKTSEPVVTTKIVTVAETKEPEKSTEALIIAKSPKTPDTFKATDENILKLSEETKKDQAKEDLKKNGEECNLDSNNIETDKDPLPNPASVETDNTENPESKSDSCDHVSDSKTNSGPNDAEDEVQPEVVFVSGRTRGKKLVKEPSIVSETTVRPVKKAGKGGTKKKKAAPLDNEKDEEQKINSAESSVPNSPAMSLDDNSVISMGEITAGDSCDADVPEADPLAVSEAEGDQKPATTGATISSFSLDFDDSSQQAVKIPIVPSPMRAVRKRGREIISLKTAEVDKGSGKRMKLKGRRQVDTALRKSVEQRIEQLHGSSSESKDSETEQQSKTKKKASRPKKSPIKKGRKQNSSPDDAKPKKPIKRDPAKKNSRLLAGLVIEECFDDQPVLRQSRRIAQLKIKEQVKPATSAVKEEGKKKKSKNDKTDKPEKRKRDKKGKEEEEVSEPEVVIESKKKKKKEKPVSRMFNENRPWQSSSEDSEDVAEEEEEEEIVEEDDAPLGDLKSDHEFSPESDLEEDNEDYQPMKRARTAKKESDEEEADEFPCQKCGKEDHPEWILLCDKCDNGWHCSCLRPPLLVIPEGDWFCPPCQHIILLEQLQAKLIDYDKKLSKKEVEDRRKERLAYVGISLNNVLPTKENVDHRKKKRRHSASASNSSSSASDESASESESDSDEPIYQLRQRRQTKNYKFNEYDEMIKTAIGEDANKPEDTAGNLGRGKDIQTIVKGLEPEPEAKKGDEDLDRPSVTNLKKMLRKKHRKLNSLEFDSEEEDISDEDFKGSSDESEEEDEEPEESDDSDDYLGKKRRKNLPIRRSTRARTRRFDADFINDDSDDVPPKRKKKKSIWDDETDTESDASGYGPKEKKKKKKKKKQRHSSDDEPTVKKNRPRIKYGGLTSSEEEELGKGRRTRGKKTTYVDTLGSDSEEEEEKTKKNPRRISSDDDEDFVAHEDEVEDEDRDSDDKGGPVEEDEEKEEADSEQERREKRSLLVPKIYIKKPLGAKKQRELEAARAKAASIENDIAKIPEEKNTELKGEKVLDEREPDKDEMMVQRTEDSRPVENEPSCEVKNPKVEETNKDIEPASNEIKTISTAIKKETDESEVQTKKSTELQQPNQDIPIMECSVALTKLPAKRGRKPKIMHEPIVSNVNALFKNDDENDDLSEPPGISLPMFDDMTSNSSSSKESLTTETPKKRRGRGPGKKKTLEESLNSIGTKITPTKAAQPAIEIAAPPQPFSQAQPTPSVITRMLQSKPGITIYPVGRIRPKQFATMRDDDSDESSPKNSPASSPAAPSPMAVPHQYNMSVGGPRGAPSMVGPYRPHGPPHPGMNHYPRGPPGFRGPPPAQGMLPHAYSHHPSHRPMDPSPSGGGPINLTDPGPGPPSGGPIGPGRDSPGRRGPPINRYPPVNQASPIMSASRTQMQLPPQQPYPPPASSNGPPPAQQTYPPPISNNLSTPQPYPPRPSSNNPPPPQQSYPSPNSSSAPPPPHQSYPPSSTSNSGPPPQQPYPPRPALTNGPPPPQQAYPPPNSSSGPPQQNYPPPPSSNNAPPPQPPYPPRPSSNSGPPASQQSYSPRPTSGNNGPPPSQPPAGYYGNYPPPAVDEPVPPSSFQGIPPSASSPYPEQYSGEEQPPVIPPPDGNSSKAYDDESGGEFAGLASYFSSQRDDDLDS